LIASSRVTAPQMRAFSALARQGSYAAAAAETGIREASLHRAVADLQVALGQRLIDRRGRIVTLTPAGQRRARGFALAMAELRAGLAEVAAWQGKAGARIVIGAMPLCRARWLPETIRRFGASYPCVDIAVHEGSHAELSGPLRDGEIDFLLGALRGEAECDGLCQEPVFVDRPAVIMRAGHPLLGSADPAQAMLDYPWILPGRETPLRQYWAAMVRAAGHRPPPVGIECGSVLTIRQLLISGDGLSLLSPDQVAVELAAGLLAAMPTPSPIARQIGITTRAGWRPTAAHAAFLADLREAAAALAP
jgi:DNA-binding transcriptional LysR family regulator